MSIICVFDMYIEEDNFWGSLSYSDSNLADYCIKNLFLICLPPICSIIFSLNYFALQHLFESYLNILWTCTLPVQTLLPEMYDNASEHWEMHMENIKMTKHAWNSPTNWIGEKKLDWTKETHT